MSELLRRSRIVDLAPWDHSCPLSTPQTRPALGALDLLCYLLSAICYAPPSPPLKSGISNLKFCRLAPPSARSHPWSITLDLRRPIPGEAARGGRVVRERAIRSRARPAPS